MDRPRELIVGCREIRSSGCRQGAKL